MPPLIDLTKQKFNRLTVLHRVKNNKRGGTRWKCRCKCGNITVVYTGHLRNGNIRSCGCLRNETTSKRALVHGMCKTPEYKIWKDMKKRCNNTKSAAYKNYGGRGIKVCNSWENDFMAFYNHIGQRPTPEHTIERINNNMGYFPNNIKWATIKEQNNNSRNNHRIIINGWNLTITQWANFTGINHRTIRSRINSGWSPEKAIFTPVRHHRASLL